jgi:hypothetical protein
LNARLARRFNTRTLQVYVAILLILVGVLMVTHGLALTRLLSTHS